MGLTAKLRSVPLSVKLLAAMLALVSAALVLIAVASTVALNFYLIDRTDDELMDSAQALNQALVEVRIEELDQVELPLPTNYMFALTTVNGVGRLIHHSAVRSEELPPLAKGVDAVQARAAAGPFTETSADRHVHWRMIVVVRPNGSVLHIARNMSDIELAVRRLIWIDVLVGGAVLVALAAVGAGIVRTSLVPLMQIERTAAAIAAGDLTQRVPDPEPEADPPRTELGRLARALNAMLAQIEAAFTARALSETAARSAESAARDAAAAAQESEARARRSEARMRQFVADA
jgi:two-component system, OmpR family, sensor kinase